MKILSAILSLSAIAYAQTPNPQQVERTITFGSPAFLMPTVNIGNGAYFLDINANASYVWATNCTQTILRPDIYLGGCQDAPTYLTKSMSFNSSLNYTQVILAAAGGYAFDGSWYEVPITLNGGSNNSFGYNETVVLADNVYSSGWIYDQSWWISGQNKGAWSLGYNSTLALGQGENSEDSTFVWSFTTGTLTDQSWAYSSGSTQQQGQGSATAENVSFDQTGYNSVNSTSASMEFLFALSSLSFGQMNFSGSQPQTGYYDTLQTTTHFALFATNFQGIGLPSTNTYPAFVTMLQNYTSDVECNSDIGGYCYWDMACSDVSSDVWSLSFKVQLTGADNYMIVPLGSFSYSQGSKCYLMVQPLVSLQAAMSSYVVLGSMFLQNYNTVVMYNYTSPNVPQITMQLQPLTSNPLNGTYTGSSLYSTGTNPFYNPVETPSSDNTHDGMFWFYVIGLPLIGLLLIGIICCWCVCKCLCCCFGSKTEEQANEVLYNNNEITRPQAAKEDEPLLNQP